MAEARKLPPLSKDGSIHVTDEFYNTLLSGIGAVLALVGAVFLVMRAFSADDTWKAYSFGIYGFGVFSVFLSSALHHGVDGSPRTNHLLRQFDYFAIFLMIAGTFTPFCLLILRDDFGWTILGIVWALAVTGILLKAIYPGLPRWIMIALCLAMGWMAVLIVSPVYEAIHERGIGALFLGGAFFTVGGIIFGLEKPNPFPGRFGFHEIWHCCVLAGAASHFYIMCGCL